MKFRKKPVVIEAVQYRGGGNMGSPNIPYWILDAFENGVLAATNGAEPLRIKTREGELTVVSDDWIIRGIKGELYPIKDEIFRETYEVAIEMGEIVRAADLAPLLALVQEVLAVYPDPEPGSVMARLAERVKTVAPAQTGGEK